MITKRLYYWFNHDVIVDIIATVATINITIDNNNNNNTNKCDLLLPLTMQHN